MTPLRRDSTPDEPEVAAEPLASRLEGPDHAGVPREPVVPGGGLPDVLGHSEASGELPAVVEDGKARVQPSKRPHRLLGSFFRVEVTDAGEHQLL